MGFRIGSKQQRIPSLTVYRLNFTATIKTAQAYKRVLIEIQKAKFATDIMRFRKYLGEQYTSENNTYRADERKVAMPIVSIYFLGQTLEYTSKFNPYY
jgi:hypothetical protein